LDFAVGIPACHEAIYNSASGFTASKSISYYDTNYYKDNTLNIKVFSSRFAHELLRIKYNHNMKKQNPVRRFTSVFLILGLAFLTIGISTDQTAFTWIAIAFVVVSLLSGGRWLRRRK
jgi:hypothetical protein